MKLRGRRRYRFRGGCTASLDLSYLVFRRRERATLSFEDRVEAELIRAGAHYQNDVEIQGRTKLNHFKFFVNGDRNAIVQPLSATSRSAADAKAERFLFHVFDVRERSPQYRVYPIVDDRAEAAPLWVGDTLQSLSEYTDGVIRCSERSGARIRGALCSHCSIRRFTGAVRPTPPPARPGLLLRVIGAAHEGPASTWRKPRCRRSSELRELVRVPVALDREVLRVGRRYWPTVSMSQSTAAQVAQRLARARRSVSPRPTMMPDFVVIAGSSSLTRRSSSSERS